MSCYAERRSLREIVVNEGFQPKGTPENELKLFKIGVDARSDGFFFMPVISFMVAHIGKFFSAWVRFQHENLNAPGTRNPELCILFYRLALILAMPVHAVFVFDGPGKAGEQPPSHGRLSWLIRRFRKLIEVFGFQWHEVSCFVASQLDIEP